MAAATTPTIADEEVLKYYTRLLRGVNLLAFGRKTCELMVPCWPEVAKSPSMLQLKLIESKGFKSGCVAHYYLKQ
jgi:hypothetical protein